MISAKGLRQRSRRGRRVGAGVGDAEAATKIQLTQLNACLSREIGVQPQGTPCRDLEPLSVEDLRADVGVDTDQIKPRMLVAGEQRGGSDATGDREAELLILMRRGDVFMGVRLDPGGRPDHDSRPDLQLLGKRAEPGNLVE